MCPADVTSILRNMFVIVRCRKTGGVQDTDRVEKGLLFNSKLFVKGGDKPNPHSANSVILRYTYFKRLQTLQSRNLVHM
jgi:hypothetical protein